MFKNIFTKLLVTYIVLATVVISTLSVVFSVSYTRYMYNEKHRLLEAAASKVSTLSESFIKNQITQTELNTSLDSMGLVTEAAIYVIRVNNEELENLDKLNVGGDLTDPFIKKNLRLVLKGQKVYQQKQYFKNMSMDVIFVGYPLQVDSKIRGAVLLFLPTKSLSTVINQVNLIIYTSGVLILLVSSFIIYLYSIRITRPIKHMEHAAKRLALGERIDDIQVTSKDEIGKLAESFNYMKNELETTEKVRRDFIANVSHDLRTPLTSINGFVQGFLDGIVKPEQYPEYLTIIKSETDRLLYLTGDILELAKIQSRSIPLHKEHIHLSAVAAGVIAGLMPFANDKNINIQNDIPDKTSIYADAERLKQILTNLISNSIRYTPNNGKVTISAKSDKSTVQIMVSDNGIGISPDDLPYIFEKFYRADKVRNSQTTGTGLGLNIVKSLVELHGGKITAESREDCGTTIRFTIPYEQTI